jgi:hypothetical protein
MNAQTGLVSAASRGVCRGEGERGKELGICARDGCLPPLQAYEQRVRNGVYLFGTFSSFLLQYVSNGVVIPLSGITNFIFSLCPSLLVCRPIHIFLELSYFYELIYH